MDVIHILGPRKALKRSKPMPNFGLPSNRPCSAGSLLKRTNGEVNIPKLMTSSKPSKFEPAVKEQCLRLVGPTQQTRIVYQAQITRKNVREKNGTGSKGNSAHRIVPSSSGTSTDSASTPNAPDSSNSAVPSSSPNTSNLAVQTKSTRDSVTVLTSDSAKTLDSDGLSISTNKLTVSSRNSIPVAAIHSKDSKPPVKTGPICKPPVTIIDMNANTGNLTLPPPDPDNINLITSSKIISTEPALPPATPAGPNGIALIGTSKRDLGNRSKLSMNSNKSLRPKPLEPLGVTDSNAGGDFNQLPSAPGSTLHPAVTPPMSVSMSSIDAASSSKTTQPERKKEPSEHTQPLKSIPKSSKHSSKNKASKVQVPEDSDCEEPQMIMCNNGAIRFQLPGRVQHKTTIKLAHYPENKSGETIVINVPEGEKDTCFVENSQNGPSPQIRNFNPGQPNLPPPPPPPGNMPGIEFPPNIPNNYQQQYYNPGNSMNGQNFFYPQSQQQYMQPNAGFDYGFMNGMNGGPGFTRNDPYNYYSGPPPQPPPQNYQPYGYGYPN